MLQAGMHALTCLQMFHEHAMHRTFPLIHAAVTQAPDQAICVVYACLQSQDDEPNECLLRHCLQVRDVFEDLAIRCVEKLPELCGANEVHNGTDHLAT